MKPSRNAILLGLLLVSCGRDTANNSPVQASDSISSNQTTNAISVNIVSHDVSQIESIARVVQSNRGPAQVEPGDKAMQEFTARWRPIGKSARELESFLGKPDDRTEQFFGYRFDTGRSGWNWVFQLSGETITNFYRSRIN